MTTDPTEPNNLHSADTQAMQNFDFLKYVKRFARKPRNRTVLEGIDTSPSIPLEEDLSRMARALSSISCKTRFSNHDDHDKLDLCAGAALLHDPDLTGMAFLSVNLIEGETTASAMSAIRKRITRSNGGQSARYFGVFVNYSRVKHGRNIRFDHHPHLHLVVLDCPKGSDTYKALEGYCRQRGKTKAPRSGNIQALDHDLSWTVGYLRKNLTESGAAGLQHRDEVIISDPIRDVAEAIGQGKIDMAEKVVAPKTQPVEIETRTTPSRIRPELERDAPVMVRVVQKLHAEGADRAEAVRRVLRAWVELRGFSLSPAR